MAYRQQPKKTYMRAQPEPKSYEQSMQEADDLLKRIGQQVMAAMGTTGRVFGDLDARYADAVLDRTVKDGDVFGGMSRGMSLDNTYRGTMDSYNMANTAGQKAIVLGTGAGAMGANIASRYMLPAGGVTLAGKGLIDIINALGGSEEPEDRY